MAPVGVEWSLKHKHKMHFFNIWGDFVTPELIIYFTKYKMDSNNSSYIVELLVEEILKSNHNYMCLENENVKSVRKLDQKPCWPMKQYCDTYLFIVPLRYFFWPGFLFKFISTNVIYSNKSPGAMLFPKKSHLSAFKVNLFLEKSTLIFFWKLPITKSAYKIFYFAVKKLLILPEHA